MKLEELLDKLEKDTGKFIKTELADFITDNKTSGETFVVEKAEQLERYLNWLAEDPDGRKGMFKMLMKDMEADTKMYGDQIVLANQVKTQKFLGGLAKTVMGNLLLLL